MTKKVFLSFHYKEDNWRVQKIKQIGSIVSEPLLDSNAWETVKQKGEAAIKTWINSQMSDKDCLIVLIGKNTANRPWVEYEIKHAWDNNKAVLGINIHNLLDRNLLKTSKGPNPFSGFKVGDKQLTSLVHVYDPPYSQSKDVYNYISSNIEKWIAIAIADRN